MLAFIIAVKHPQRSSSYERVTEILRQTLSSVQAQSTDRFVAIVVCNRRPDWAESNDRRLFVEVDFPPAALPSCAAEEHSWSYLDKGAKNAVGLWHARRWDPTHVMFVDADDFVSRRLAEHVAQHPTAPGWYFENGLTYSGRFKIAETRERFWSYCGTSHILRFDLLPIQLDLSHDVSFERIVNSLDHFYLQRILGCHLDFEAYLAEKGLALQPLPFVGAVWHTDTGENASRAWWKQTRFGPIWGKPLTREQSLEFTIPRSRRQLADTLQLQAWRARNIAVSRVRGMTNRDKRT